MANGLQRLLQALSDRHDLSICIPRTSSGFASSTGSPPSTPTNISMGIKESGDYITARGANPRTGLISPSVMTAQSPSTPMTPGEALRIYGHRVSQDTPTKSHAKARQSSHQRPRKMSVSRWKQNDQGWFEEAVLDTTSVKKTSANSSAVRAVASIEDDLFLPTPLNKQDPAWKHPAQSAARAAAAKHGQGIVNPITRILHVADSPDLNGRMPSVGAGPRKFAEASKKLRTCALRGGQETPLLDAAEKVENAPSTARLPFAGPISTQSSPLCQSISNDDLKTVTSSTRGTKHGHHDTHNHDFIIPRRPVGIDKRRNGPSGISATATCIVDHSLTNAAEHCDEGSTSHPRVNIILSPHQLLRVRPVNPNPENGRPCHLRHDQPYSQFRHLPIRPADEESSSGARLSPQVSSTHDRSVLRMTEAAASADHQAWQLVANLSALPLRYFRDTWIAPASSGLGVRHALHTLTDDDAELHDKWVAGKLLLGSVGRWTMVLGLVVAAFRVAVMVLRILNVLFWPLGIVLAVVKWSPF